MNKKLSAIDLGFLYTKAIVDSKQMKIKSVIGDAKPLNLRDMDMGSKDTDDISSKIGDKEYFVSDLAINQSDVVIHSLKPDRFNSDAMKVLVRSILGLCLGSGEYSSYFVSGLPVSHYHIYKDAIEELFMSSPHEYDVTLNGKANFSGKVVPIKGKFVPQPFGAGMDLLLDDKGAIKDRILASSTMAIIDPGFGTTDVYTMNSLSPVEKLTFTTPTAMNQVYRLLSSKIEEKFDVSLPLYKIDEIMTSGKFRKFGNTYDMSSLIKWALQSTAEQLLSEIFNKWKNMHEIDIIYVAGGGGIALFPYLSDSFSNIHLIEDSQWSIARGYYKWGIRSWSAELMEV